jgi:hypothetical protein
MKRFCSILLSLGLVMAVSAPAFALDVKFSGSFYAAGMYLDKTNLRKVEGDSNPSTAFYFQGLRMQTDFIVSPGLSLITRFDAMKRAWGAPRSNPSPLIDNIDDYDISAGTPAENENIAFDLAYIQYASPIGIFTVGYQLDDVWGTVFGDNSSPRGKIGWSINMGGWTALVQIVKIVDYSKTAKFSYNATTDLDYDKYIAGFIYHWKGGETGARLIYNRNAIYKGIPSPWAYLINLYSIQPYAKAQIGPVTFQAELDYYWGEEKSEDGSTFYNAKLEAINFFIDAVADFNMFYVGGTFAYLSGDDLNTLDKKEGGNYLRLGGATGGGIDWNPCLILWNFDRTYWAGKLYGLPFADNYSPMQNAWFGQIRGGMRPIAALDIMASVSYAVADQKPLDVLNKTYGWEVDLSATYKITNNLSYMLGIGYLFTGDYFKGALEANDVRDDYLIINKLTLTF